MVLEAYHRKASSQEWHSCGASQFWVIAHDAATFERVQVQAVVPDTHTDRRLYHQAVEKRLDVTSFSKKYMNVGIGQGIGGGHLNLLVFQCHLSIQTQCRTCVENRQARAL